MRGGDFKVIVFADDLTGANDTGVQIVKRGLEAVTVVDPSLVGATLADGIVLDTESRTLPSPARATRRRARSLAVIPSEEQIEARWAAISAAPTRRKWNS